MLTTLNHLVGLPVVFQGEQIGQVERCVADKSSAYLQGLIIRQGLGGAKWVPSHLLETLGRRCVIIRGQPEAMPGRFAGEPKLLYLTNGQLAGEITDVVLADQSLRVVALEVSAGLLQRLTGQRQYATEYHIRRTGSRCGEAVASGLISWVEMNERLKEDGIT